MVRFLYFDTMVTWLVIFYTIVACSDLLILSSRVKVVNSYFLCFQELDFQSYLSKIDLGVVTFDTVFSFHLVSLPYFES